MSSSNQCRVCGCHIEVITFVDKTDRAGYCSPFCVARADRKAQAMNKPMNARFWVFVNDSWVKLTVRPDQPLSWGKSWNNGEGWSWTADTWTHDSNGVRNEWGHGGNDCDGRVSTDGISFAELGALRAVPAFDESMHNGRTIFRPEWQKVADPVCADAFAEAAGY